MLDGDSFVGTTPDPIYSPESGLLREWVEPELRRLAAAHPDAMISAHTTLGAYFAVLGSERLADIAGDELLDRFAYDFVHPDDVKVVAASHKGRLLGSAGVVRYRFRAAAGSYIAVETTSWFVASGQHEAICCVTRRVSPATP